MGVGARARERGRAGRGGWACASARGCVRKRGREGERKSEPAPTRTRAGHHPWSRGRLPTQGSLWGYLKVNSSETLSIFDDKCPKNGSKNDLMAPRTTLECPHEGPSVEREGARGAPGRNAWCSAVLCRNISFCAYTWLAVLGDLEAPRGGPSRGGKSYFSCALICTTNRRIPVSASTNQGPEKGDLMHLVRGTWRL